MVLFSNVFMLLPPIGLDKAVHEAEIVVYYSLFNILYNIGYAMANVSHLAMIPELCDADETRTSLTLIRNSMISFVTILANLAALIEFSSGKLICDLLLNKFGKFMPLDL